MALWICPKCGNKKNIICPVCGEEKEAGEICKNCGSEFSFTKCNACGFIQYHEDEKVYPNDYIEKIKMVISEREKPYITYYELMRIAAIRFPEELKNLASLEPSEVRELSELAFQRKSIEPLLKIMKPDLAGFILSFLSQTSE